MMMPMMHKPTQLGIRYDFGNDVYLLALYGIGLFWIEPDKFAPFALGCLRLVEENHPELLPDSDVDAMEQVRKILEGR